MLQEETYIQGKKLPARGRDLPSQMDERNAEEEIEIAKMILCFKMLTKSLRMLLTLIG